MLKIFLYVGAYFLIGYFIGVFCYIKYKRKLNEKDTFYAANVEQLQIDCIMYGALFPVFFLVFIGKIVTIKIIKVLEKIF